MIRRARHAAWADFALMSHRPIVRVVAPVLALVAVALAGCDGGGGTSVVERTVVSQPTAASRVEVTGIFLEPRADAPAATQQVPPAPEMFGLWDFESAVIYDIANKREINLGRGSLGSFSPDGRLYAWIADPAEDGSGELRVFDLADEEQRALGQGRSAIFVDEARIVASGVGGAEREVVDAYTGERTTEVVTQEGDPGTVEIETPAGYVLRDVIAEPDAPVELVNPATGNVLLRFEASRAMPAGEDAILMMTGAFDADPSNNMQDAPAEDTVNIFLIDIETGEATFVATARGLLDGPAFSVPIAASDDFVAWTPYYCGIASSGRTRIYERATGAVRELEASLLVGFTPEGLLTDGIGFGVQRLLDPRTLEHVAVIPLGGDIAWSEDYRYAAHGITFGGHGGPCP